MNPDTQSKAEEKLVQAYDRMLERTRGLLERARRDTLPDIRKTIDRAQEKAVELGELTLEEAERIGEYLNRDLHDAAEYLSYTGKGLADWLHFDPQVAEARLMEVFSSMVDQTRVELDRLAEAAKRSQQLRTGEVVGPGTLACDGCDARMNFRKSGHIPPCSKCRGTVFARVSR